MSQQYRPQKTRLTICDLCDEPIPNEPAGEKASLTGGFISHPVEMPKTKWIYLVWPPAGRDRLMEWKEKQLAKNRERHYDFHAQCVLDALELEIHKRRMERQGDDPRCKNCGLAVEQLEGGRPGYVVHVHSQHADCPPAFGGKAEPGEWPPPIKVDPEAHR